jgi:DNA-binding beta-propeller fold protein YncE
MRRKLLELVMACALGLVGCGDGTRPPAADAGVEAGIIPKAPSFEAGAPRDLASFGDAPRITDTAPAADAVPADAYPGIADSAASRDLATATPDAPVSTPDGPTSAPDAAAPVPDATAPTPDTTPPVPDTAAPTPDTAAPAPDTAPPASPIVGKLARAGLRPYALALYEAGNKVFVADQASGNLFVYDTGSLAELGSVAVGTFVWTMVVDEQSGKLYAKAQREGTDGIAVVDAKTNTFIEHLTGDGSLTEYGNLFQLVLDPGLRKLYALHINGLTQIDVTTDTETKIPGFGGGGFEFMNVNTTTHEVFVTRYLEDVLVVIDGATRATITTIPGLGSAGHIAVNTTENKLYLTNGVDSEGYDKFTVIDRDDGSMADILAKNDALGPWTYDPGTNRVFTGSEVNAVVTTIDGASNAFTNIAVPSATTEPAVRFSTRRVYYAGQEFLGVLDAATLKFTRHPIDNPNPSAIVAQDVAIHQAAGRVFVIHDRDLPFVTVAQD